MLFNIVFVFLDYCFSYYFSILEYVEDIFEYVFFNILFGFGFVIDFFVVLVFFGLNIEVIG